MVRSKAVSAETSSANVAVAAVRPTVVEEITMVRSLSLKHISGTVHILCIYIYYICIYS